MLTSCGTVKKSLQNDILVHEVTNTEKMDSTRVELKEQSTKVVEATTSIDTSKIVEVEEVTKYFDDKGIINKEVTKKTKHSNINKVDTSKKDEHKENKEALIKYYEEYLHRSDSLAKDNSKKIDEIKETTLPKQLGLLIFFILGVLGVALYIYKKLS